MAVGSGRGSCSSGSQRRSHYVDVAAVRCSPERRRTSVRVLTAWEVHPGVPADRRQMIPQYQLQPPSTKRAQCAASLARPTGATPRPAATLPALVARHEGVDVRRQRLVVVTRDVPNLLDEPYPELRRLPP
jgi:hypothetical protein